ncbi:MAG: hypothetical protein WC683_02660 [bacterium]
MTRPMTEEKYSKATERIAKSYGPKILAFLERLATGLRDKGLTVDAPEDMSCDDYKWGTVIRLASKTGEPVDDTDIDLNVELAESLAHEGTTDGVTFRLEANACGGAVIGVWSPWNYTERCWVDVRDKAGLTERAEELLSCESGIVPYLLGSIRSRKSR